MVTDEADTPAPTGPAPALAPDDPTTPPAGWTLRTGVATTPRLAFARPAADDGDGSPPPIDQTDRNDRMAIIRETFSDGQTRTRDDAIRELSETIGYDRLGPRIRETLDDDLRTAVRRGILENSPAGLCLLARNITEYRRDHLIAMLLSDIGGTWWDREELIRATARYLGYRRTGSAIVKELKSALNGAIRRELLEYEGNRVRKSR